MTKDEKIAKLESELKEKDRIITMLERQMMLAFKEVEDLEDKLAKRWSKKKTLPSFASDKRRVVTPEPRQRARVVAPGSSSKRNWDPDFPVYGSRNK